MKHPDASPAPARKGIIQAQLKIDLSIPPGLDKGIVKRRAIEALTVAGCVVGKVQLFHSKEYSVPGDLKGKAVY